MSRCSASARWSASPRPRPSSWPRAGSAPPWWTPATSSRWIPRSHAGAARHRAVVTVEDGTLAGGFGAAVLEVLAEQGVAVPVRRLGLPDSFIEHGAQPALLHKFGLDADGVAAAARDLLLTHRPSVLAGRSTASARSPSKRAPATADADPRAARSGAPRWAGITSSTATSWQPTQRAALHSACAMAVHGDRLPNETRRARNTAPSRLGSTRPDEPCHRRAVA